MAETSPGTTWGRRPQLFRQGQRLHHRVMAGLVPAIHAGPMRRRCSTRPLRLSASALRVENICCKAWMPGTSPGMTWGKADAFHHYVMAGRVPAIHAGPTRRRRSTRPLRLFCPCAQGREHLLQGMDARDKPGHDIGGRLQLFSKGRSPPSRVDARDKPGHDVGGRPQPFREGRRPPSRVDARDKPGHDVGGRLQPFRKGRRFHHRVMAGLVPAIHAGPMRRRRQPAAALLASSASAASALRVENICCRVAPVVGT